MIIVVVVDVFNVVVGNVDSFVAVAVKDLKTVIFLLLWFRTQLDGSQSGGRSCDMWWRDPFTPPPPLPTTPHHSPPLPHPSIQSSSPPHHHHHFFHSSLHHSIKFHFFFFFPSFFLLLSLHLHRPPTLFQLPSL